MAGIARRLPPEREAIAAMRARLHSGLPQSASAGMAPSAGRSILQGEAPLDPPRGARYCSFRQNSKSSASGLPEVFSIDLPPYTVAFAALPIF